MQSGDVATEGSPAGDDGSAPAAAKPTAEELVERAVCHPDMNAAVLVDPDNSDARFNAWSKLLSQSIAHRTCPWTANDIDMCMQTKALEAARSALEAKKQQSPAQPRTGAFTYASTRSAFALPSSL